MLPGSPGTLSPTVLELTLPVRPPRVLGGSLDVMFAVPSMGRMGSRGWGRCRGASARAGRNGARVNRDWHRPAGWSGALGRQG